MRFNFGPSISPPNKIMKKQRRRMRGNPCAGPLPVAPPPDHPIPECSRVPSSLSSQARGIFRRLPREETTKQTHSSTTPTRCHVITQPHAHVHAQSVAASMSSETSAERMSWRCGSSSAVTLVQLCFFVFPQSHQSARLHTRARPPSYGPRVL